MARAIQRLSDYPLVLLTNTTHLPDGTSLADSFLKLNVHRRPVFEVPVPGAVKALMKPAWRIAYWKLQIWRLTDYEKLIWMDTDAILFRSIDWLFERTPMWGQRTKEIQNDNWACEDSEREPNLLCLMLVEPSQETYDGIVQYAAGEGSLTEWWIHGDEKLISDYFKNIVFKPIHLLELGEASFGRCLGKSPNIPYEASDGPWNFPAFIHRSSLKNECFDFNLDAQLTTLDGKVVNFCTYHPVGPYWRDTFCNALDRIDIKTNDTQAYCDDFRWYRRSEEEEQQMEGPYGYNAY